MPSALGAQLPEAEGTPEAEFRRTAVELKRQTSDHDAPQGELRFVS
jgi:hypothetical protein